MPRRKTHEEFLKDVYKLYKEEYTVLGRYQNNKTHILMRHNECGNEWSPRPDSFVNHKKRCPKCYVYDVKKQKSNLKKKCLKLTGDEYKVIGEYTRNIEKIKMLHKKCGREWNVTPNHFFISQQKMPLLSKI